jgi:hypothetical protein
MRYTLRLLTLDQLGRAAGLICALELERRKNASRYGVWPFEIGLWVGKAATPESDGPQGRQVRRHGADESAALQGRPEVATRSRSRSKSARGAASCSDRSSFDLVPNEDAPKELRIVVLESRVSVLDGLEACRSSRSTSRFIAACRRSSSRRSTSSRRCRGTAPAGCCSAARSGSTRTASVGPIGPANGTRLDRPLPAAGLDHPGRTPLDLRTARHDRRAVRDRDRGSLSCAAPTRVCHGRRSSPRPRLCDTRTIRSKRCSVARARASSRRPGLIGATRSSRKRSRRTRRQRGSMSGSPRRAGTRRSCSAARGSP